MSSEQTYEFGETAAAPLAADRARRSAARSAGRTRGTPRGRCPSPSTPGAEAREVAGYFAPLPGEACAVAGEFKMPYRMRARFVVQTPGRAVQVFLDGELLHAHDGAYQVPAIHRTGGTSKDVEVNRGWHRLTVRVAAGEPGPLSLGIGDGGFWDRVCGLE